MISEIYDFNEEGPDKLYKEVHEILNSGVWLPENDNMNKRQIYKSSMP